MMRKTAILFSAVLIASPLRAQDEGTVKAYAEFAVADAIYGGGLSRINSGLGFNVAGVITTQQPLFFAIGIQYSKHTTTDFPDKLSSLQTYVEPRLQLVKKGKLIPYA